MENKNEIIINDAPKVRKPFTEAQKQAKKESMRQYYLKKKSDPEYIERKRLSSKTHYYATIKLLFLHRKIICFLKKNFFT